MATLSQPAASQQPPFTRERAIQLATVLAAYLLVNTSAQLLATTLPDIQGDLAATADEGSWIGTAFTMGILAGVVIAPHLMRAFGLGRYTLACAAAYAGLALVCASAPSLPIFVGLRAAQGLAAGGLGPSAFVAVFTLAGRPRLMGGLALLAFVLLLPTTLGPVLAGPIENGLGWRGLFCIQAVAGGVAAVAAFICLPRSPIDPSALRADWTSVALLAAGLGSLTLALSQGARRFWLESDLVLWSFAVAAGALAGFSLLVWRRPGAVIDPRLLVRPGFAWPVGLNLLFRTGFAVTGYLAPQFLIILHGYRPQELSGVLLWSAVSQILALPVVWWMLHRIDGRMVMAGGLVMFGTATALLAQGTAASAAEAFRLPMALIGAAQVMFLVPALQAGAAVLTPPDGPTASIAFNVTSTGGVTVGVALATHLSIEREKFHSNTLVEYVSAFGGPAGDRLMNAVALLGTRQSDEALTAAGAASLIGQAVRRQAWTLAFNDALLLLAGVLFAGVVGVLFIGPQRALVGGQRFAAADNPGESS